MPPRGFVIVVFIFWIGMSALLFQRSVLPRWQAEDAPAYAIELTDEVGSPEVSWDVYRQDAKIGSGITRIRRQPDRTFEMSQQFRFDDFKILVLDVKRLDTIYRVTRAGRLLGIKVSGQAKFGAVLGFGAIDLDAELDGEVKDGFLEPKLEAFGSPVERFRFGKIPVADNGSILNPMHLVHRLPRLQEGQRWKVPLFDPFAMFSVKEILGQKLPVLPKTPPYLDAQVVAATMTWNREEVACLRVDYREPGKDEVARTWVRRADGLVLAQEAKQHGYDFSIRRVPEMQP
jgi:hypothetical protein